MNGKGVWCKVVFYRYMFILDYGKADLKGVGMSCPQLSQNQIEQQPVMRHPRSIKCFKEEICQLPSATKSAPCGDILSFNFDRAHDRGGDTDRGQE